MNSASSPRSITTPIVVKDSENNKIDNDIEKNKLSSPSAGTTTTKMTISAKTTTLKKTESNGSISCHHNNNNKKMDTDNTIILKSIEDSKLEDTIRSFCGGIGPTERNEYDESCLMVAARDHDEVACYAILCYDACHGDDERGRCWYYAERDRDGNTLLHWSIARNNTLMIRKLLDVPEVPIPDKDADNDSAKVISKISQFVNTQNNDGLTPLFCCVYSDCGYTTISILQLLLEMGADINCGTPKQGYTPLHLAAHYGKTEIIRILLQNGANPTIQDYEGLFPINHAIINKHSKAVKELMSTSFDGFKSVFV